MAYQDIIIKTQAELSYHFGVSRETIKAWKRDGLPVTDKGFNLRDCIMWKLERTKKRYSDAKDLAMEKIAAQTAATEELAKQRAMENEQNAGRLVALEDVEREVVGWCVQLRSSLLAIPDQLAALVPGELKAVTKQRSAATVRQALQSAVSEPLVGSDLTTMAKKLVEEA